MTVSTPRVNIARMARKLSTPAEIIEKLGGLESVRKLTNRKTVQVVWNWKDRGSLPPDTYFIILPALKKKGCTADRSMFGLLEKQRECA